MTRELLPEAGSSQGRRFQNGVVQRGSEMSESQINRFATERWKRTVIGHSPPSLSLRLRAWKNRRRLFGLDAPASMLSNLVPPDGVAIDAGANLGLYTYWIARRASAVHAFEPNAGLSAYLRKARIPRVQVYSAALSSRDGSANLWIPQLDGEASLSEHVGGTPVEVPLIKLDSLCLPKVGFMKIDVEGHELEVLRGGEQTIRASRPTLFVEIEQRHHPEQSIDRIIDSIRELGYDEVRFLVAGTWHPLDEFRPAVHQADVASRQYASNFLFSTSRYLGRDFNWDRTSDSALPSSKWR